MCNPFQKDKLPNLSLRESLTQTSSNKKLLKHQMNLVLKKQREEELSLIKTEGKKLKTREEPSKRFINLMPEMISPNKYANPDTYERLNLNGFNYDND